MRFFGCHVGFCLLLTVLMLCDRYIKLLVGEIDFSIHIHDSASSTTATSSSETLLEKGYQEGGKKGKKD